MRQASSIAPFDEEPPLAPTKIVLMFKVLLPFRTMMTSSEIAIDAPAHAQSAGPDKDLQSHGRRAIAPGENYSRLRSCGYRQRLLADNAKVWRAICSSSFEGRASTKQLDPESLIGLLAERFRVSSRVTPIKDKPPQIAARVRESFCPMPPVKTRRSNPSSAAIIAATCLRTE